MATNKSMIEALEKIEELINELGAYREVLKNHIVAQKKQHGQDWSDKYVYYPDKPRKGKGKVERE